jgi:Transposase/Pentapeptide repeats (8 copies)
MKRSKFTEQQIASALQEAEGGRPVGEVCRTLGISQATFFRWKTMAQVQKYWREEKLAFLVILGLVLVIAVFLLAELIGRFDCWGCNQQQDIAKAISDARASLLQVAVGVAGAAALYFTWQTYLLGREGRASDNFIKAVDQLGNEQVHVKVGGIVGLGRLLRTATVDGDYWFLMDVLTAFVRHTVPKAATPRGTKPSEDIIAAINVLARRSQSKVPDREEDSPVDLTRCDLGYLWMAKGHYEAGQFGDSVLTNVEGQDAFFYYANFDRADLTGAQFDWAKMKGAKIRWVINTQKASFKNADLTDADFEGTDLRGVSLQEAIVSKADFSKVAFYDDEELRKARGDRTTQPPPGFSPPPTWT